MKKNLQRLLITVLILFCLFTFGLYFILSSSYFIKSYLFPAITNATGVRISTGEVYLSHLSTEIKLKNYSIEFNENVVVDGEFASFKYDFWELLKGKIYISNLVLNRARVNVRTEDSNIKAKKSSKINKASSENTKNKNSSGFEVNIKNIFIQNSELQYSNISSNAKQTVNVHLNDIDIFVPEVGTSLSSDVKFSFSLSVKNQDIYKIDADNVKGNISFTTENWNFSEIEISSHIFGISGSNKSETFENRSLYLDLNVSNSDDNYFINKLVLMDMSKNDQHLISLVLNAELRFAPFSVMSEISKLNVSSNILNIIGSFWELDFGKTSLDYNGKFVYTGADFGFTGNLKLENFNFAKSNFNCLGEHAINLNALGNFKYDYGISSYKTDKLDLVIDENNNEILELQINDPVTLVCGCENFAFKNSEPASINFKTTDFDLSIVENIFCRYFSIQLLQGILNCNLNLEVQNEDELLFKGNVDLSKSGAVFNKLRFDKIDLKQSFNLIIKPFHKLLIKNSKTIIAADSVETLNFRTKGTIDFSKEKGDLIIKLSKVSGKGINNLPGSPGKMLAIKDVNMNGFIDYAYTKGGDDFSIKTKLAGGELEFFLKKNSPFIPLISGNMELDISKNDSELNFKKYICNLYLPNERLGNLAADGKIFLNGPGKSELNLYSEGIRLKKLIDAFKSLAGSFNINFNDMSLNSRLVLENIEYGPYINFDCEAGVNIDNGVINADPILILLNTKPIMGKIIYDFKAKHNNYFNLGVNASNIEIEPILKTYDPLTYSNSKGVISNFSVNVEGKGFSRKNLQKNLKGDLNIVCRDVSLPDNPENNNYVKLLFIPIEVISQMNELFGNVNLPAFFNNLIKYSQDIFNQMKNLDLKYGVICVEAEEGKIIFKHIVFKGDSNPISWLKFKGELGFDETVDITSKMKLNNYVIVPLHISGTLKNPKPNMMSLYKFVEKSAIDTAEDDFMYLVELPEIFFDKLCYESDIFFQSIAP